MKAQIMQRAVWPLIFLTGLVTGILVEHRILSRILPDDAQVSINH